MANLEAILKETIKTSGEVADFIRKEAELFDRGKVEYKGKNDLVSYVDKQAEEVIVARLREALPEAGFVTEEETENETGKEFTWIIDPLDGTTNFIHGIPAFSISIGLMHEDEMVLGVVHEINSDDCYYAIKDQPAYCNDKVINVSPSQDISSALIATGFPYLEFEHLDVYFDILREFMEQCHGIRRIGSAAIDLAYVASGKFEGFFEFNLNAWDVAAGAFLVQQAGGTVTDFKGSDNFIFGRHIIAGNQTQAQMLKIIQDRWVH